MKYLSACSYLAPILDNNTRPHLIDAIYQHIEPYSKTFSAIAVMGTSGLLVGPIIARELNKNLIIVRKNKESSHSHLVVEGPRDDFYLFLDDLINTGLTFQSVVSQIATKHCEYSKCVGGFLYNYILEGVAYDPINPWCNWAWVEEKKLSSMCEKNKWLYPDSEWQQYPVVQDNGPPVWA